MLSMGPFLCLPGVIPFRGPKITTAVYGNARAAVRGLLGVTNIGSLTPYHTPAAFMGLLGSVPAPSLVQIWGVLVGLSGPGWWTGFSCSLCCHPCFPPGLNLAPLSPPSFTPPNFSSALPQPWNASPLNSKILVTLHSFLTSHQCRVTVCLGQL